MRGSSTLRTTDRLWTPCATAARQHTVHNVSLDSHHDCSCPPSRSTSPQSPDTLRTEPYGRTHKQLAEVLQDLTHHPFAQKPPSPPRSLPRRGAALPRFTVHCAARPASRPTSRARPTQRAAPILQHQACRIADESTIQPPAMSAEHQARHRTLLARSRSARVPAGTPRGIDLLAHLDQDRLNREYLVLGRPERLLQQQRLATTAAADGGLEDLEPTAFGAELARSL
ncbi:hypothetical protein BKA62DRAFT_835123 [Auriculariales sp. MPI-PUGE-AT-0066]|nr:hypothetical protein BKA62DRAFT_835123 [Auriculariales sp. MPI-PUGE-AT-0066]